MNDVEANTCILAAISIHDGLPLAGTPFKYQCKGRIRQTVVDGGTDRM